MANSDDIEVYSPNVGGKRFLKNKFFSLGGLPPWTVSDGGEVYSPNVGGKRFLKKSSLALAGCRRGRSPTVKKCSFLPRAEKEQDNYAEGIIIFKRVAPKGTNLRFAPSGLPHSRHGLAVSGVTLIGARCRHHAFR